ncbi:hypothetical protein COW36_05260 [bacterium (Candidatus Blackallbacteria) CG17_big_fil_post_rev_8_21_14_2_50_48_46]|uniref:FHA domain-containing protein n=1 Tax=bacterium (Candidatus Blackallbacteria) CG17_big_fil_post_rev_8_21_14_2_50_48_46 TaxID=2014261 RepID=A0A2M7G9C6_9BACT|nr:MAG: hypothetical protein COW64_03680 [bacterium (Candidatus Blackallbacteria) CG18_big_fil_WC_8_21_14_2_50_49_26]PIW18705.1 MAG: hypothetical protein COW36_05260 [bacterium (Candidatus Blackallbacteria) CG17_big_fil_post_rev_8_21_14_2_50_48_46]PIW46308.1 MAG: hypothetical protein COW20_15415 [bacterium (Candidatus Blackallbacteria) CG13_big_fil_rev_8_21_14_2_50_49_14]
MVTPMDTTMNLEAIMDSLRTEFSALGYAWELVMRGVHYHLLDENSLLTLLQHLHQHQDYILDELAFEFIADQLRIKLLDESETCSAPLMFRALAQVQTRLGKGPAPLLVSESPQLRLKDKAGETVLSIPTGQRVLVGRGPDCDLSFPSPQLGRRQAYFQCIEGVWTVEDAESPSGTYVNDEKINRATPLQEGDQILLGGVLLSVAY